MEPLEQLITVRMANGSTDTITHSADFSLTVGSITKDVRLRILGNQGTEAYILFGRDLLARYGITDSACKDVFLEDGTMLYSTAYTLVSPDVPLIESPSRPIGPTYSDQLSPEDNQKVCEILEGIVKADKQALPLCDTGSMVLVRVGPNDVKDTPSQRYRFQLTLEEKAKDSDAENPSYMRNNYSRILYEKLTPADKLEFERLILQYEQLGWWRSTTQVSNYGPRVANVFATRTGSNKKLRLVSDCRAYNISHPASASMPKLEHPLLQLRILPFKQIVVADATQAFYHVGLVPGILMYAGERTFECNRLCFGVAAGVEALRRSLGLLFDLWKQHFAPSGSFSYLFVDDLILTGSLDSAKSLFSLMEHCGFSVSNDKLQTDASAFRVLGINFRREGRKTFACCEDKSEIIKEELKQLRSNPTKQRAFALAGVLGYDPLRMHIEKRVCSDLLRSLVGSEFSKKGWQSKLEVASLDVDTQKLYEGLLTWVEELCKVPPCRHLSTPSPSSLLNLRLETDASSLGRGFVVFTEENAVWTDGGIWKRAQLGYHINRLEAMALFYGLRAVCLFIERLLGSFTQGAPSIRLTIATDSSTALSWAKRGIRDNSLLLKSPEYRQVLRLCEGLREELSQLDKLCSSVILTHIPGESNRADAISRLMEKKLFSTTLGVLYRNRQFRTVEEGSDRNELCAIQASVTEHIVDAIARECSSLSQLIFRVVHFSAIFGQWSTLGGHGTAPDPEEVFSDASLRIFVRICQTSPFKKDRYAQVDGLSCYDLKMHTGVERRLFVIPAGLRRCKLLIMRHYHLLTSHRGGRYLKAALLVTSPFWVESVTQAVTETVNNCLVCARKNASARAAWAACPQVLERKLDLPALSRMSLDILSVQAKKVLVCVCIDTGYLVMEPLDSMTTTCVADALVRIGNRFCLSIQLIHTDNQTSLKSKKLESFLRSRGHPDAVFSFTVPYSPWQNPVERCNRDVISVLRTRKASQVLSEQADFLEIRTLEAIGSILNRRPIGVHKDDVLTPAFLAFGSRHGIAGESLRNIREFFYENFFLLLRRRHQPVRWRRLQAISVGDMVLCYDTTEDKDRLAFKVCKVVRLERNSITCMAEGRLRQFPTKAVVPLPSLYHAEPNSTEETDELPRANPPG